MEYTKRKWVKQGSFIFSSEHPPRLIAVVMGDNIGSEQQQANTSLIIAAVNASASINPDNPIAVAESIKEMYEALKQAQDGTGDWRGVIDLVLAKADSKPE